MIPNVSFGWFVFKVLHLIPWRALRGWDSLALLFSSLLFFFFGVSVSWIGDSAGVLGWGSRLVRELGIRWLFVRGMMCVH
jgi:hypothetical protein